MPILATKTFSEEVANSSPKTLCSEEADTHVPSASITQTISNSFASEGDYSNLSKTLQLQTILYAVISTTFGTAETKIITGPGARYYGWFRDAVGELQDSNRHLKKHLLLI